MFVPRATPLLEFSHPKKSSHARFFVKDESVQPYRTHKDRRSRVIVSELSEDIEALGIITAGNAGHSLAKHLEGTRVQIVCILDESMSMKRELILRQAGAITYRTDLNNKHLSKDDIEMLTRQLSATQRVQDVTNGYSRAYAGIIEEIEKDGLIPSCIVAPVGSGELVDGIKAAIDERGWNTKIIGVCTRTKNSAADKLYSAYGPRETSQASTELRVITNQEVGYAQRLAKEHNLDERMEPSSSVVLLALDDDSLSGEIVLINTGRGLVD